MRTDLFNAVAASEWRFNAVKDEDKFLDLLMHPIGISGDWVEGPPLRVNRDGTYSVDNDSSKRTVGIYVRKGGKINIQSP